MVRISASLAVLLFAMSFVTPGFAKGNDVEFHGTVVSLSMQSTSASTSTTAATQGILTLRVMGIQVPVRLTSDTEIEAHGDEVGQDGISVGDFVKISGFFTNGSIVAREVEVLDGGEGEFRLRGPITAVGFAQGGTVITVLGIGVLVDSDTKIERRGSNLGLNASNLAVAMFVDARGSREEGQLVARRIKVGFREDDAIRVEFAGKLTAVAIGRLMVDTEGGSSAAVLIANNTVVVGAPAVGKFVEVRGTLNSLLEVVATRVVVKNSRDDDDRDDDDDDDDEFKKAVELVSIVSNASSLRGEAEVEVKREDGRLEQEFELEIRHALPNTVYGIRVEVTSLGLIDFGTLRTNSDGRAEVQFTTRPRDTRRDLRPLLPAGKTVRDFVSVQITIGNVAVLQGRF
jgi:hypothetical protein